MENKDKPANQLGEKEVAVIARYVGLTIPDDRLPRVTRELNIAMSVADDLLPVDPADVASVSGPFDPAWPAEQQRGAR